MVLSQLSLEPPLSTHCCPAQALARPHLVLLTGPSDASIAPLEPALHTAAQVNSLQSQVQLLHPQCRLNHCSEFFPASQCGSAPSPHAALQELPRRGAEFIFPPQGCCAWPWACGADGTWVPPEVGPFCLSPRRPILLQVPGGRADLG